ncbi:hypothetical protein ACL02T_23160 [Pseudonocardia sp. RS010]|uniref:hypothetical protein n=1 Tax=Pseudonocardia sp. RS010 TaxID=3385979 RepID=UPI00399FD799
MTAQPPPGTPSPVLTLDRFLPTYDISVVHTGVFRVPPQQCHEALLSLDAFDSPLIRLLIAARGLPERLIRRHPRAERDDTFLIRDMTGRGWLLLGETPGVETVLGSVGRPWTLGGAEPQVTAETFADFADPGFAKIAISFRVTPYGSSASILVVETRALLTDARSRRRFLRYWRVVGPFSHLIRRRAFRMLDRRLNRRQGARRDLHSALRPLANPSDDRYRPPPAW